MEMTAVYNINSFDVGVLIGLDLLGAHTIAFKYYLFPKERNL